MDAFKSMERQGIQPDVVAHNAAITACAKVRCFLVMLGQEMFETHACAILRVRRLFRDAGEAVGSRLREACRCSWAAVVS